MSYDLDDHAAPDADDLDAPTLAEGGASSVVSAGPRPARARHVSRSRRSFHRFYRAHFGLVWSLVRRFGVPSAQHEDVVQEVWLIAYRRLHTLEPDASAKAWLSSIARHVASRQRRTDYRHSRKLTALGVATKDAVILPSTIGEAHDARRVLDAIMGELDEDQRDVLLLSQVHGLTGPEIAQALEIPLNTAYSRLRLARRRVDRFVAEAGAQEAAVIGALRRREEPPPRAAARVWMMMAPELGLGIGGASTAAISSVVGGVAGMKAFAVTVVVGVVGLLGARAGVDAASAGEPPVVTAVVAAAVVSEEPATLPAGPEPELRPRERPVSDESLPSAPAPAPARPVVAERSAITAAARPAPAPSPSDRSTLTAEAELLGRAQGSLRTGDAAAALRLLEEHERRFPLAELGDERRGARVRALCELGRAAQARAEALELLRERPHSPVAAGVADVCSQAVTDAARGGDDPSRSPT